MYVNYIMLSFFYYVFHLSTMFVYSTTLRVHQPFDTVMENSGVKTRSSEQTMLSDEAHILLPPEVYALINLARLCFSYRVYGVLHCDVI